MRHDGHPLSEAFYTFRYMAHQVEETAVMNKLHRYPYLSLLYEDMDTIDMSVEEKDDEVPESSGDEGTHASRQSYCRLPSSHWVRHPSVPSPDISLGRTT